MSDGLPDFLRPALRRDGPRLCRIFKDVTMESDLHLAVERDPDFFALYDMQQADCTPYVLTLDDEIEGMGTFMARDGYIDGEVTRIGYAGDLRFTAAARGARHLADVYGPAMRDAGARFKTNVFLTAVITSNRRAVAALTGRRDRQPDMPVYTPIRRFRISNVQYTTQRRPRFTDLTVRTATADDIPKVAAHLHADHKRRSFGYVFTEELLRHRLAHWPGLSLQSFYLAFDQDRLVGVTAAWDAQAVKRYRVLGYYRAMRWIRMGFNLAAFLARFEPLPPAGGLMKYFYLTHVSVPSNDPAVMAALVDHIYTDHYGRGYHFFCACVLDDDPLAEAFSR